ncbi:MAG: hypothetical protein BGO97_07100 [Micrococcales bacterium 70-64]|nr:hypothetical protein [Leifsonia sp.]ODU63820.1 MAG: hypothetical protein ABT06_07105 [Leifsonia sp. SCN 70-46]OJX85511.1 MAG: hypothetical protein BGO97_07100 [Micrococcales bacterium 70-64]
MAAATLAELVGRVDSLNSGTYVHTAVGETIVVSDPADPEYSLVAALDDGTFRLTETKPAQPTGPRRFDAGGIYNAAKRAGLRGHMPQRRQVKEQLVAFLQRNGWTKA